MLVVRMRLEEDGRVSATVRNKRTGDLEKVAPQSDKPALLAEIASKVDLLYSKDPVLSRL